VFCEHICSKDWKLLLIESDARPWDFAFSVQLVERLLNGSMPGVPRIGFALVDVRDIAHLHIRAMLKPEAAGQRILGAGQFMWAAEVACVLKERLGSEASKVPTRLIPDYLVRLRALFDPSLRSVISDLGRQRNFSRQKATSLLGWTPRSTEESIVDCARSLIEHGVVSA